MSWLFNWRERRRCFHHNHTTGESWIRSRIIDGARKMYWCDPCGRTWFR